MRLLLSLIFCLSLYIPSISFATPVTDTTDLQRFTAGWTKQYRKGWNLNGLELAWKIPQKKSFFYLSVSGSKHKFISEQTTEGDAAIEFLNQLRIEFGDTYKIIKESDRQLWLLSLAYEFYPWEKSGNWWKMNWNFYPSIGIMGQYQLLISSSDYILEFDVGDSEPFRDELGIPTGITNSDFDFIFPACLNFDFAIVTLRTCGLMYTERKPAFSVTISGGL